MPLALALGAMLATGCSNAPRDPLTAEADFPGGLYACVDDIAAPLVTTSAAAMRTEARIDAPIALLIPADVTVSALEACPSNGYYAVTANGATGWICGNHLNTTGSAVQEPDAGETPDSGTVADAGTTADRGDGGEPPETPDAGHGEEVADAGVTPPDAGTPPPPDAGTVADAGGDDAGVTPPDAGTPPAPDAGTDPGGADAGSPPDAGSSDAGTPPPPPPPSGKLFVGYYQSWSDTWQSVGANTKLAKLPCYVNVVNLSFMFPNANYVRGSRTLSGTGLDFPYDGPTLRDGVTALHQRCPETRVMVSVGGATYTNWGAFAPRAVADFVADFGLDGVDLDYEPWSANCTSNGTTVTCPSDTEYVNVVKSMRAALPAGKWLSMAAWSVGAYGEGAWANAPPTGSAYTGIALAVLKDARASAALDLVNVMSYDAGPTYSPQQAFEAYKHYFSGRIAMGIEVPPEAWGGHVATIAEIDALARTVREGGGAGLMLWSIQKYGPAQQFATQICNGLGLSGCSTPML